MFAFNKNVKSKKVAAYCFDINKFYAMHFFAEAFSIATKRHTLCTRYVFSLMARIFT